MKHLAVVRALVCSVAVILAGVVPAVGVSAGSPSPADVPGASPWPTQAVVIVRLSSADGSALSAEQLGAAETVVRARLAADPGVNARVSAIPADRLRIELADVAMRDRVGHLATAGGWLQFMPVPEAFVNAVVTGEPLPAGMAAETLFGSEGVLGASVGKDGNDQPSVDIEFRPDASQVLDDFAATHVGSMIAILLDGEVLLTPVLRSTSFGGSVQLSGSFDLASAQELVAIVTGGVLPVAADVLVVCPATGECPAPSLSPDPSPAD
jgi:preprotein translocase subunit SecD